MKFRERLYEIQRIIFEFQTIIFKFKHSVFISNMLFVYSNFSNLNIFFRLGYFTEYFWMSKNNFEFQKLKYEIQRFIFEFQNEFKLYSLKFKDQSLDFKEYIRMLKKQEAQKATVAHLRTINA